MDADVQERAGLGRLKFVAALTIAAALGAPLRSGAADDRLTLVDGHFHVMPSMDLAELLDHMDRNGIRWAGAGGAPGGPQRIRAVIAALGDRYIRAAGGAPWLALARGGDAASLEGVGSPEFQALLNEVETGLRDRGARVIGEILVNNTDSAGPGVPSVKTRANGALLKALLDLAAKYKRPLMVHAQWDDDTAAEIRELAASNRNARLLLAHCGSTASAAEIRQLFEDNPNIVCDLSARNGAQLRGRYSSRAIFSPFGIQGDWARLIEDFPDRFIVGIDHARSWSEYDSAVESIRAGLLANLKPATAERVAHANAQAWYELH